MVRSCVSTGDFGCCGSISSGTSKVTSVQTLSGESGSSLAGCGFFSVWPGRLKGECPCYVKVALFKIRHETSKKILILCISFHSKTWN